MNRWLGLVVVVGGLTSAAEATTDLQCLADCTRQGYLYTYCSRACDDRPAMLPDRSMLERPRSVELKCLSDCLNHGYLYGYCQRVCEY